VDQPDHQALYENLTDRARRALHRADDLGYEVRLGILTDPAAAVATFTPVARRLRLAFKLKGFEGQAIRGAAPLVEDDPSVDCIAIEAAILEALAEHDNWFGLVVA
jgi:hypothetical protein